MADQIVLAWTVDVTGTPLGPAEAANLLGNVPLYVDDLTDPVLGQLFGLTVDSDVSVQSGATEATRTLRLNMTSNAVPQAPAVFPCRPITSTPPTLPYPLLRSVALNGDFFVSNGSASVPTTGNQIQTINVGDTIEFLSQHGVSYEVLTVTDTDITLTTNYSGVTGSTGAFRRVPAPATRLAVYSTSDFDTAAINETEPAIPAGPGVAELELSYLDSTGAPFTAEVALTGRRPAMIPLEPGSLDVAVITGAVIEDPGGFENSVGQITIVELSEDVPGLPLNTTPDLFRGRLTDEAQLLIQRHLAYFPPSYFALAQQQASLPPLEGDFLVKTGSTRVVTEVDQTGTLVAGNIIQFASQMAIYGALRTTAVLYTIEDVGPRSITLTSPYTGIDDGFTGTQNLGVNSSLGTKGNVGAQVFEKATAAYLIDPSPAASPTDDQLAGPLGQFVEPATVGPPPPLVPTFLSDLFTQTLQLALAVPVVAEPITFLP